MNILQGINGSHWIEITKEEYELNKDNIENYCLCFDQDTNKGRYFKRKSK